MSSMLSIIFSIVFLIFLIPIIALLKISDLRKEVDELRQQILKINKEIKSYFNSSKIDSLNYHSSPLESNPSDLGCFNNSITKAQQNYNQQPVKKDELIKNSATKEKPETKEKLEKEQAFSKTSKLEKNFGLKLPVWVGAIAIILSGFYLVKYTIDSQILTSQIRVILGVFASLILQFLAFFVGKNSNVNNRQKISVALSGSGIAIAYLSIFAATSLYNLISPLFGFILMSIITSCVVYLSIKYGQIIALLGLLGGFISPILISSDNSNSVILTIYLCVFSIAIFELIKRQGWWFLSFIIIFILALIFNFNSYRSESGIVFNYYLLAICCYSIFTIWGNSEQNQQKISLFKKNYDLLMVKNIIGYFGIATIMFSAFHSVFVADYKILDIALFSIFSLSLIIITYFRYQQYKNVCWLSLILSFLLIINNSVQNIDNFLIMVLALAIINILGANLAFLYLENNKNEQKKYWALFFAVGLIGFYMVSYFKMLNVVNSLWLWATIALYIALVCLILTYQTLSKISDFNLRQHLAAVFSLTASIFVSVFLLIQFNNNFFSTAIALQILFTAFIATKVEIKFLRKICLGLFVIFILWLIFLPNSYSSPLFYTGIPALSIGLSCLFLRREKDDQVVNIFEVSSIIFLSLTLINLVKNYFDLHLIQNSFLERGLISAVLFIVGVFASKIGIYFKRQFLLYTGLLLASLALLRVMILDVIIFNPYFNKQDIGGNYAFINYLLPIFILFKISYYLDFKSINTEFLSDGIKSINTKFLSKIYRFCAGALLLMFLSVEIAQFYRGSFIYGSPVSNAEIYAYSVIWLLFALLVLWVGIVKNNKDIRIYSLVVITITMVKVFLFDMSNLDGLYRVFSFLGLGFSLIFLSYIYSKYVFNYQKLSKDNQQDLQN